MGFFNMYFNETIHPINIKYSGIKFNPTSYTSIKTKQPPFFFDDRYKNRILKLKQNCYCCYAKSESI